MIGFTAQTVTRALRALESEPGVRSLDDLMVSYFLFDLKVGEFSGFGSRAYGSAILEQCLLLKPVYGLWMMDQKWLPMLCLVRQGGMKHLVAWPICFSPICKLSYLLLVCIWQIWMAGDLLGIYCVQDGAVLLLSGVLPDFVARMVRKKRLRISSPPMLEHHETGTPGS